MAIVAEVQRQMDCLAGLIENQTPMNCLVSVQIGKLSAFGSS